MCWAWQRNFLKDLMVSSLRPGNSTNTSSIQIWKPMQITLVFADTAVSPCWYFKCLYSLPILKERMYYCCNCGYYSIKHYYHCDKLADLLPLMFESASYINTDLLPSSTTYTHFFFLHSDLKFISSHSYQYFPLYYLAFMPRLGNLSLS